MTTQKSHGSEFEQPSLSDLQKLMKRVLHEVLLQKEQISTMHQDIKQLKQNSVEELYEPLRSRREQEIKKPVNEIDYQIEQQTVICEEELFDETALEEEKKELIAENQNLDRRKAATHNQPLGQSMESLQQTPERKIP